VDLSDVLLELVELDERRVVAFWAAESQEDKKISSKLVDIQCLPMFQQPIERLLQLQALESDPILLLIQSRSQLSIKIRERSDFLRENDLKSPQDYQTAFHNLSQASPSAGQPGRSGTHFGGK
jgi:hypothetical protein